LEGRQNHSRTIVEIFTRNILQIHTAFYQP
jgi:hypothetical protein